MDMVVPKPGTYVLAVSGGVDSVVLLHALQEQPDLRLVVAHYDHGIRDDAVDDRHFVAELTALYGLPFVYDEGHLGAGASEQTARQARYTFLHLVRQASGAAALITAHHQDDVLETAIINMLRGTGRKGLTALHSTPTLQRPLLGVPKTSILAYAHKHNLKWHEDSTNQDDTLLRNYVRHRLLPAFSEADRAQLLALISDSQHINQELDALLVNHLHLQGKSGHLDRQTFQQLPHAVARELMAAWLRSHELRQFDTKMLERLVVAGKTAQPGHRFPVTRGYHLAVEPRYLALQVPER